MLNDYIAQHSDYQKEMINNAKISIISLYEKDDEEDYRTMNITAKKSSLTNISDVFEINMYNGMILTMCGTTQDEFTHGIYKEEDECCKRISISFRQMN